MRALRSSPRAFTPTYFLWRNTHNSRNSSTVTDGGISLLRIFLITNSATFMASSSFAQWGVKNAVFRKKIFVPLFIP
jgi:hypothetical protein